MCKYGEKPPTANSCMQIYKLGSLVQWNLRILHFMAVNKGTMHF